MSLTLVVSLINFSRAFMVTIVPCPGRGGSTPLFSDIEMELTWCVVQGIPHFSELLLGFPSELLIVYGET